MSDKPSLCRESTMAVTAKIGKELLGGEKLGDTRQSTSLKKAKRIKKVSTMSKTIEEAKVLLGKDATLVNAESGRTLRTRVTQADKQTNNKRKTPTAPRSGKRIKKPEGPAGDHIANSV